MLERDQLSFGFLWPTLAAAFIVIVVWRAWPRGRWADARARVAGALGVGAAIVTACVGLLGVVTLPPTRVGAAAGLAAAVAALAALIPARGWKAAGVGAFTGLLVCVLVAWPWLAAGRERTAGELGILAGLTIAGSVFLMLARVMVASSDTEPQGWIPLGLAAGAIAGASGPLLAVGGAWTNAALVAGGGGFALLVCFLAMIGTRPPSKHLSAAATAMLGALPVLWIGAHLASELPWWTVLIISLAPAGWFAGLLAPRRMSKSAWLRNTVRVALVGVIAFAAAAVAISLAPVDAYLEYAQ